MENYFSRLDTGNAAFITGLLIGQSSPQRDYIVLSTKTPHRDQNSSGTLDNVDIEWVTEHAKQVSRMLPGGLTVLGVFLIVSPELSKEATNLLRKVVFAVDKYLSKESLYEFTDEEASDRVVVHICSKTRKVVCKTFDVRDPKSSAKPADWKYQGGVSSNWPVVTCSIGLNLCLAVSDRSLEEKRKSIQVGLGKWAKRIASATCLLNGRLMAPDMELGVGGKGRNPKLGQQKFQAQFLLSPPEGSGKSSVEVTAQSSTSVIIRGQVCCRAYLHGNKPRAGQAVEMIKRDVVNTVVSRVDALFDDLVMNQGDDRRAAEQEVCLPLRVFAPLPGSGVCVCDYMFPDEEVVEVAERFQEMLDCSMAETSIISNLEVSRADLPTPQGDTLIRQEEEVTSHQQAKSRREASKKQGGVGYMVGGVIAGAVALLAAATSLLYLSEE